MTRERLESFMAFYNGEIISVNYLTQYNENN